jgi:threonine/homoserine/homoserine lactone efflux protein
VFGASIGLSALLMASSAAFTLVKWLGAAYLCFLGIKLLLSRSKASGTERTTFSGHIPSLRQVFWQGALTNVLNPKVALFFLAFLPQFVASDAPHKAFAFLLLGLIFVCNGTAWCLTVAAFAAQAAGRIRRSNRILPWINRALGGLFIYLGIRIAALQARAML